jgi:hypothetical protein
MSSLQSLLTLVSLFACTCSQGAALRWQNIITAEATDRPAGSTDWSAGVFAPEYPGYFGPVDDIVIFYRITPIDGKFGILGQAGPLWLRGGSAQPISGFMEFDFCTYATQRHSTCFY